MRNRRFTLKYARLVAKECYRGYRIARLKSRRGDPIHYWQELRAFRYNERTLQPFDRHRCIFVHVPKTGGQSVSTSLFGTCTGGHRTVTEYMQIFGEPTFNNYFKFSFVRNPWDRLVSTYHFCRQAHLKMNLQRWAAEHLSQYEDFESFVRGFVNPEAIYGHHIFVPQHEFVCKEAGTLAVDFLGRYENLAQDFAHVRHTLGDPGTDLSHLNATKRRDYSRYYTKETQAMVARAYRKDIELFGYQFEPAVQRRKSGAKGARLALFSVTTPTPPCPGSGAPFVSSSGLEVQRR